MTQTDLPDIAISLKKQLKEGRQLLANTYANDPNPKTYLNLHCQLVDNVICTLWQHQPIDAEVSILAVGGYGRGQLFPYSDIDLLVLIPPILTEKDKESIGQFVSLLWDIGLEVGHSVRSISECLEESIRDITIETTLLEHRLIAGCTSLADTLGKTLNNHRDPLLFLEGKLIEQQQRHHRYFGGTNNLEPNVKESAGGLRDLHTIIWLSEAIGLGSNWQDLLKNKILTAAELKLLRYAEKQIQKIRIGLHLIAKRREDRLIFDLQQNLAKTMGFEDQPTLRASEQLMKVYYRAAKTIIQLNGVLVPNLRAYLYFAIPRRTSNLDIDFYSINGMLGIHHFDLFKKRPTAIFEAFLHLQRHPELNGMAPKTLRALWHARGLINDKFRKNPVAAALFIQMFKEPGLTRSLRRLNLYGVLGKYIPAFAKVIGQMQHDLFHIYTVDEHILMVVRNLRRFAMSEFSHEYPLMSKLMNDFKKPELLYLAGLFHDIAKGRGGDHSVLGVPDAEAFCQSHQLSQDDTELITWLVRHHLTMSNVAQKQDIYDPETITRFTELVQTPTRLTALYLLTVADIRGTSPKIWNAWKAKLLEDLYFSTLKFLNQGGEIDSHSIVEERQAHARAELRLNAIPDGVEEKLWKYLDTVYFLRHNTKEIAWHARLLNRFVSHPDAIVKARLSEAKEGIQVLVYSPDQGNLFAKICAFFGRKNYSIADARIYTTNHGYALDTFHIFIPEHPEDDYRDMINYVEYELRQTISNNAKIELPPRGRVDRHLKYFPITPQVIIRPDDKDAYFILSIISGDKRGLLAKIALLLSQYHINVHSAKIMTLGHRVEDSFLLSGASLNDTKILVQIESELIKLLS